MLGIKQANAKDMIKEADTNNEGSIDFLAFANLMSRKMAEVRRFFAATWPDAVPSPCPHWALVPLSPFAPFSSFSSRH